MRSLSMVGLVGVALVAVSCQDGRTPTAVSDHSIQLSSSSGGGDALWEFDELVGVPRPFTGPVNAIRGVRGGGLPWVIDEGEARLDEDGELRVKVEGLVLDPNDPAVIARGLAGNNPVGAFRAILSCLTVDANGNAATVNLATATSPATTGVGAGDAEIRETLVGIPDPCIAPIVFVTSPGGSWFAAGGPVFDFDELVGVPRPFTGGVNAIRGVRGGGLPWAIDKGEGELDDDGELEAEVEGLVLDPNDPAVIARGLAGNNPVGAFKAILSCLTVDENGFAATVNLETATVPATTGVGGGDAEIEETLSPPDPCIAPIVFVTSPGGSWFAASGF